MELFEKKLEYYRSLDCHAKQIAQKASKGNPVSEDIMLSIVAFYQSAKIESNFYNDKFSSSYHSPITSELEFFIARVLFHFSEINKLGWIIYLRKQKNKTAPDIRIEKFGRTLAVIEIKAKAGWIQPFLSEDRYQYDVKRGKYNPDNLINGVKAQLVKYQNTFNVSTENIYFLLPTLVLVHRKRYKKDLNNYYEYFSKTSGLPKSNLILLSEDMLLDLSKCSLTNIFLPTTHFESMLKRLRGYTQKLKALPL